MFLTVFLFSVIFNDQKKIWLEYLFPWLCSHDETESVENAGQEKEKSQSWYMIVWLCLLQVLFRDVILSPHPCSLSGRWFFSLSLSLDILCIPFLPLSLYFYCVLLALKQQQLTTIHKKRRNANAMDPLSLPLPKQVYRYQMIIRKHIWKRAENDERLFDDVYASKAAKCTSRLQFLVSASRFLNQAKRPTCSPFESLSMYITRYTL